ncbi:prepilin peptidase [Thalassotalea castellviae]|uniref:Prepilin leader peptidase/N-methyltransferase n=1 Tax=Thalassotalea castellviae TaxID=3075612 RepID=A0ABU2ZZL1_9GAMM|nr:A24 family peptidase [Thalassotalea sp. W431]MDT0603371.1 A24 family peptidase [Thalassotalea sp. W431]
MFSDVITAFEYYPLSFYITVVIVGLTIGSFLNVVIFRLPKMLEQGWYKECREFLADELKDTTEKAKKTESITLSKPNSTCPHCNHEIRFYENIPVLSWLMLKGKCSQCKTAISIRYPIVESVTALLSLVVALHYGVAPITFFVLILTWGLICLTMIDFDHMLLPDQFTYPLLWLGLLINIDGLIVPLDQAVIGAVAGYMSLFSVFWLFKLITGKEGMGHGDFKLLAVFGAWMGWQLLPLLILMASAVGAIIGISLMIFKNHAREQAIPFGPYLAIAGWICLLWGEGIWQSYLSFIMP